MGIYESIVKKNVNKLKDDYDIGNKCGRSLFSIVNKIKLKNGSQINFFRLPFKENNVAGFVGYKNNQYVIFTNTSKNLGYEIFTLAHEIYHLLENDAEVRDQVAIKESEQGCNDSDDIADMFAAELLMPKLTIIDDYNKLLQDSKSQKPDNKIIIQLQQEFYVEYKAVTNRLREIELIDEELEKELNTILLGEELNIITKKLGYTLELNSPSNKVQLPMKFLLAVEENYENREINYDDLMVIFSYCNQSPEEFGYKQDDSLSDSALQFLNELNKELETRVGFKQI